MTRVKLGIPFSIVLFLAFTAAGIYFARKSVLERAMSSALAVGDRQMILKLAASRPAPVNIIGPKGQTPLVWAVEADDVEAAKFLLSRGADVNATDNESRTPMCLAVEQEYAEMVRMLLDHGASVHQGRPILRARNTIIAGTLIDHGAELFAEDENGRNVLHLAAMRGDVDLAIWYIRRGADVNARDRNGSTPLHEAGETGVASALLAAGAAVNAGDSRRETPLHEAVKSTNIGLVELLLRKGADVNAKDSRGDTPLHEAALAMSYPMIERLIARGADVNAKNNEGRTPLEELRAKNPEHWRDIGDLLLRHGAKE